MAKNVYKPQEVLYQSRKLFIEPPRVGHEEISSLADPAAVDVFSGPTVEDLRREAEEFKRQWDVERQQLIDQAKAEAERIKKDAEQVAFDEVKRKNNQAQKIRQEAQDEANTILTEARARSQELETESNAKVADIEKRAYENAYKEGHDKGYAAGEAEVKRLVERLHVVLSTAIEKRREIIDESETQVVNLVLLIAKKVIKVISENQKNVVINNVIQALRKLKSRGEVVIRVNFADLELTTSHVEDFMKMVENVKSITVLEDATVDRGGCVIETDFGEIDARISSQLNEIEEKVLELAPIRQDTG